MNLSRRLHNRILGHTRIQQLFIYIYIYSFSRRLYPKRLTIENTISDTVMNLVATLYISCTTLQLHITYGLHLPSFTALTHSHPPLHQSHSCHQSLISLDCLTTPAPHSHTHILSSTLTCTHRKVLFLPRLTFLSVIHPAICYLCV